MTGPNIAVVLDPYFGSRLISLAQRLHVWACDSPENTPAVQAVWAMPGLSETGRGATRFGKCQDPEAVLLSNLDTIDLHHPHWLVMEIYGLAVTPRVDQALRDFGVTGFRATTDGFIATRSEQQASD